MRLLDYELSPMPSKYPLLKVKKPNNREYIIKTENLGIDLSQNVCITIGREESNHIVLNDPQKNISRQHCSIYSQQGRWWIVDRGSSNGTFLRRNNGQSEIDIRNEELVPLKNEDEILILGELDVVQKPIFWRLQFIDSEETNHVIQFQVNSILEYSLSQQKLFRIRGSDRTEIVLQDKELTLIDYMSRKNYRNQNRPLVCQYEELIQAVWGEDAFGVDKLDIHHLVWRIRHKIESDSGESQFLKTVRGRGYRLEIKILS